MAKQIVVDLVGDTRDFQRGMDAAASSARKFETATDSVDASSSRLSDALSSAGDAADESESKFMGTADLLDGLATTMGLNVGGAIDMARGFGDMASGVTNALIPALTAGTTKVKTLTAAFLASPTAKYKLGIAAAAAATGVLAAKTEAGANAVGWLKDHLSEGAGIVGGWIDTAADKVTSFNKAADSLNTTLDDTRFGTDDVTNAMGNMSRQVMTLGDFSSQLDGILDNMNYSYGDLAQNIHSAAVQMYELYKRQGLFLSQAQGMRNLNLAGPYTQSNENTAFVPTELPDITPSKTKITKHTGSTTKKTKSAVDKIANAAAKALTESFNKVKPKLQAALKKFQDSMQKATDLQTGIRSMFKLDFGDDIGHNVTETLKRQVARWEKFVKLIASLRKKGLRESLVRQFAAAGPDSLEELQRINAGNLKDINTLVDKANRTADTFANKETIRQTGIDPNKPVPVKLTLDVKGDDLKNLIKKWVRTEGGGDVQVAFGKKK